VTHEIRQRPDGTLTVAAPEAVERWFGIPASAHFVSGLGRWKADGGAVTLGNSDTWSCASAGGLPDQCRISATVSFGPATRSCGLMLRTSPDLESGYYVRLEPARRRIVLDSWPRPGDRPHWVETERPLDLEPYRPQRITALLDRSVCEVYVDDRVAMSVRLYDHARGDWGVFASEGEATFRDVTLAAPDSA
jgi:beta-fructofuranosidase